jgi:hypothetical protein
MSDMLSDVVHSNCELLQTLKEQAAQIEPGLHRNNMQLFLSSDVIISSRWSITGSSLSYLSSYLSSAQYND